MRTASPSVLLAGLGFPEGPRWHDGRLWFSDMHRGVVGTVDLDGGDDVVATIEDRPCGPRLPPDGTPLVVSADRRHVLRIDQGTTSVHADLEASGAGWLNDMVVDGSGRAWVDAIRHHDDPGGDDPVDQILVVEPDGSWHVAAEQALRPNGIVLADGGRLLIHASTRRRKLIELGRSARAGACPSRSSGPRPVAGHPTESASTTLAASGWARSRSITSSGSSAAARSPRRSRWRALGDIGVRARRARTGGALFMTTQDRDTAEGFVEVAEVDVPAAATA